jgi:hypothetical protein
MKQDKQGYSTCPAGQEQYEEFTYKKVTRVQYDYRDTDGSLFTCVAKNLAEARTRRDAWKQHRAKKVIKI